MADLNLAKGLDLLDRRTRIVRLALLAYIGVSLLDVVTVFGELTGVIDTDAADLSALSSLGALVYVLFVIAMVGSMVIVGMWIYRAHANLRAAGIAGLEFRPGWAVGWYFIPFANFFKPFQAMRELWAHSLIQHDGYGREADPQLKAWWGAWIVGNIASNIAVRLQAGGEQGVTVGYALDIVSTAVLAVAAWLLIQIVERVNAAQRSGTTMSHAFA